MESAITGHLDEGDLVRILDGEVDAGELAVLTAHLRSCESCRRLRDEIGQQSAWFRSAAPLLDGEAGVDDLTKARAQAALRSSLLGRGQTAPRMATIPHPNGKGDARSSQGRKSGLYYRLAAAGIGVILFAALAVEPVRAWITDNVLSVASRVEEPARENVSAPPVVPTSVSAGFSARGPVFRIDLAQHQQQGTLTIRLTSDEQASARIIGSSDETLTVVLPSGLRVGNRAESSSSYIVELPAAEIREVVVRAGGQPLVTRTLSAVGEEIELDLATEVAVP